MLEVGTFNTHLEGAPRLSTVKMHDLGSTMRYTMVPGGGDDVANICGSFTRVSFAFNSLPDIHF